MKKVTVYFISKATNEIHKGKYGFDKSIYKEGSGFNQDQLEEYVEHIFKTYDEAKKRTRYIFNLYERNECTWN